MSVLSEQEPTSPHDPLHYAPRRRAERSGIRLSTVTSAVGETQFDSPFRVDTSSSPFSPSLDVPFEDAIGESLRRHLDPQVMPEPAAFARDGSRRRKWLMVGGGIAAGVGVAAVAALLLVTLMPASRDGGARSGFAATAAQPRGDDAAKTAISQFRSVLVSGEGDQAVTREQPQQLLERFMQWRQKTDSAQHQQ
ncbi:hypothetical protein [Bradyrhizobium sp. ARR65]|uniref:hypothetical protein n=1 Tax=Bradyrhizobium sp. ARR65 TaxID=1040989 RepID=UPI000AD8AC5C|nr:hypothetical protein [Bradyrhizobium sp. ARR65]